MRTERKKSFQLSDNAYAVILSIIFLFFGAIIAWHHEMWRDEIQAWLIAIDTPSPIELFKHLKKYEGHPGLWHLCLYALKFITQSPIIMQPFHLIIAATTVYLFSRFAPFTQFQKALFAFGYFPFYEYAIICRNYAIGILLLFLFCTLFKNWKEKFPLIGFILLLFAHTSVHALIIVISIGIALFWELIFTPDRTPNKMKIGIGFFLITGGIITSIIQLKPAEDQGTAVGWMTKFDLNHLRNVLNIMPRVGGVAASSMDYKYPFSQGKSVARFIKQAKLDDMLIAAAGPDDLTLEIVGYLEKDKFYYPRTKRFGSFGVWDMNWRLGRSLPYEDVLQEIKRLSDEKGEDILIISVSPLYEDILSRYSLTEVKRFEPSVINSEIENYCLYRLTHFPSRD